MDKKSKIFLVVFFLLIAVSVAVTYWKTMVRRNYIITAQADCDPYTENCFVHICDPDPNVDGPDACKGNPEDDTWFTKNISRKASNIPDCDPNDENCTAFVCDEGEADCSYEFCDENNVPEGDTCNDPVQYNIDNPAPADEEAAPCDSETSDACPIDESAVTTDTVDTQMAK